MVKKELANVYRITNGRINNIYLEGVSAKSRSGASPTGGIRWGSGRIKSLYHEAGHIFELANQEHLAIAKRFIKDRATGKEARLSTLTGIKYKAHEKAYPDSFSDPYVGKIYADATEVLSMGLEILGSEDSFAAGIADMEHLEFCFGCFTSEPVKKNNQIYSVGWDTRIYSNEKKRKAWEEAIDNAMPSSFVQQLYGKGVERYKVVEEEKIGLLLKHNSKALFLGQLDDASRIELARMAYLAICNFKGLIPGADPTLEKVDGAVEKLLINAPKWFTPLTELPRL